jgi:hypothetical protein
MTHSPLPQHQPNLFGTKRRIFRPSPTYTLPEESIANFRADFPSRIRVGF